MSDLTPLSSRKMRGNNILCRNHIWCIWSSSTENIDIFRWVSRRSFDLGNRRKLWQSGWSWLISGTQSVFLSDRFLSFGFKIFWDVFENRSTTWPKLSVSCSTIVFALRVCLTGVCVFDFGFDITVYVILWSDLRVFVFVVRLRLFLQFVCVCFFLIKSRYLYLLIPVRCMSVHLYLPWCIFIYNTDLAFFARHAFEFDVAVRVFEFALAVCLCLSFVNL